MSRDQVAQAITHLRTTLIFWGKRAPPTEATLSVTAILRNPLNDLRFTPFGHMPESQSGVGMSIRKARGCWTSRGI